jgi:hypothetical protein
MGEEFHLLWSSISAYPLSFIRIKEYSTSPLRGVKTTFVTHLSCAYEPALSNV